MPRLVELPAFKIEPCISLRTDIGDTCYPPGTIVMRRAARHDLMSAATDSSWREEYIKALEVFRKIV